MKLLYVVSTLSRSGPTNQLYYLVSAAVARGDEVIVLTLSPEPKDTLYDKFILLNNVELCSLALSRISGLFLSKKRVFDIICKLSPDVIHSQGIRADSLISSMPRSILNKWMLTIRNYPFHDYPMKFGKIKGAVMAWKHVSVLKRCTDTIACSESISKLLASENISSTPIRNGSQLHSLSTNFSFNVKLDSPIFITVGSLIVRKNVDQIVNAFNRYKLSGGTGSLILVGDGVLRKSFESKASSDIYFTGNVKNVTDYLSISDFFISASLSEGMPNTVLEALLVGLPCFLSDIDPHLELYKITGDKKIRMFNSEDDLSNLLNSCLTLDLNKNVRSDINNELSSAAMAEKYHNLYQDILMRNA